MVSSFLLQVTRVEAATMWRIQKTWRKTTTRLWWAYRMGQELQYQLIMYIGVLESRCRAGLELPSKTIREVKHRVLSAGNWWANPSWRIYPPCGGRSVRDYRLRIVGDRYARYCAGCRPAEAGASSCGGYS